ncbi:MAG: DUF3102 domain-containing protein [Gammaproteobacteria bacterium]|nr:DUF3102 domain-containing protein [Gammaproteobacteria bacterium]
MSTLVAIAHDINREHRAAHACASKAVEHARRAGELLLEAKANIVHGEWLPWLAAHVEFSERTAQAYMRVARELPKLEGPEAQRVSDLPLRAALEALSNPSPVALYCRRLEVLASDIDQLAVSDPLPSDTERCAEIAGRMSAVRDDLDSILAHIDLQGCARVAEAARRLEVTARAWGLINERRLGDALNILAGQAV